jgi:guanylate cyclase soluble subunit beta
MHGWINDTLEKFILDALGADVLEQTRAKCGFAEQRWELLTDYPDGSTFALVFAVCEITKMEPPAAIEAFGGYFMKHFRSGGYASLLRCQGGTLRSWLSGVNDLHTHLKSVVSDKFNFPELWCTDDADQPPEKGFILHYMSQRGGSPLSFLVVGIAKDAAAYYFDSTITMELLESQGADDAEATTWRVRVAGPEKEDAFGALGPVRTHRAATTPPPSTAGTVIDLPVTLTPSLPRVGLVGVVLLLRPSRFP